MCENRHSLRVGAGFVIDSGRHGHARGSCRTYGRKERAHRSLQNHRTVLHKLPHASSSCPIRRPKHQNLSGCWVATHRFCGGGEIPIEFVGLRPGEKLSEELVGDDETAKPSGIQSVRHLEPVELPSREQLDRQVRDLEHAARRGESATVMELLKTIVPSYSPLDSVGEPRHAPGEGKAVAAKALAGQARLCPACGLHAVYRSRTRSAMERIRKSMGDQRLHRCSECGWRGWISGNENATVTDRTVLSLTPPGVSDRMPR